ncbi:hypothetical protein [Cellulomonas sp. SG140]|uniref:hypothetical protein n=1 Tax=Cellulomonas sp. SG140 TaxID=2976536 RepID=UPI0021E77443|nr:hypothetical protein [Cellulomonas sp. SG140]
MPQNVSSTLIRHRAEGLGKYPSAEGVNSFAIGRTYKQLRSWAIWADALAGQHHSEAARMAARGGKA